MKKYRYLFSLVLLWAVAMPLFSQVVSNDNEDEVYKIDSRFAQNDFVPGQVLVKFKDECRVGIQRSKGKFMAADCRSMARKKWSSCFLVKRQAAPCARQRLITVRWWQRKTSRSFIV